MAQKTRTYLKGQFESGDTPTEQDFINLIDSISNFQDDKDYYGINTNITAHAGGGQADAYELSNKINIITTVNNTSASVKFQAGLQPRHYIIYNRTGTDCRLYPPIGGQIDELAANAFCVLPSFCKYMFVNYADKKWIRIQ